MTPDHFCEHHHFFLIEKLCCRKPQVFYEWQDIALEVQVFSWIETHKMKQDTSPLNVPQKLMSKTGAIGCTLNQTNIRNCKRAAVIYAHHAKLWPQCRERIISYLGRAAETVAIKVDFPALGNSTSPTSAISNISSRRKFFASLSR